MSRTAPRLALLALAPLAVVVALARAPDPREIEARRPLIERAPGYRGSSSCRACHPDQYASWERTFHRTMTQYPGRASVLGRFDGEALDLCGQRVVPFERDGRVFVRLPAEGGEREAEVALCVGSRRYQQYFERVGDEIGGAYRRLPILWHVGEARWMPVNGVFLEPDGQALESHAANWNTNCIFCHNTAPQPHVDLSTDPASPRSRSRVGELGIACEACHGPGEAHVRALGSPLARYALRLGARGAPGIVQPEGLGPREALAVCGQCHSQRVPDPPERIREFLSDGPSFRPGARLEAHVAPVSRATPSPDPTRPELFAARFWRDGTARLTAYEYLGVTQSPCFAGGELTCSSCHAMHAGDPHGNILPELRGDRACTGCHVAIGADPRAHTHHDPERSGGRCLDCHMPRIVYGILEIHRSHRIEVPDVARDVEAGRPNVCTACHLDRGAVWAADAMRAWWGASHARPGARPDHASLELPEALASLHAGDAVQRAVYAAAFGRTEAAPEPRALAFALPHLVIALGDGYPSVRFLARRSLLALDQRLGLGLAEGIQAFDVFAPPEQRRERLLGLLDRVRSATRGALATPRPDTLVDADFGLDLAAVRALLELQSEQVIAIGE